MRATTGVLPRSPASAHFGVPDLLLHPLVLASVVGLLINDYWAKRTVPSWATGKASDAFGAVLLTAVGTALVVFATDQWGQRVALSRRLVAVVAVVVVISVAMVKTSPAGASIGGWALGILAWPLHLPGSIVAGQPPPWPSPVEVLVDPFDAVAAGAAFVVVALTPKTSSRSTH